MREAHTDSDATGVMLAWVIVDDARQHVTTWMDVPRRARPRNAGGAPPRVRCPVCGCGVVLKLGPKMAPHAAHVKDASCPVTKPESALHFNLKCRIAEQLNAAAGKNLPLRIQQACAIARWIKEDGTRTIRRAPPPGVLPWEWTFAIRCGETHSAIWAEGWDRAVLEDRVAVGDDIRIPDLVLYSGEERIGAVEVFNTHAVDAEKARDLDALRLRWIEVDADPRLLQGETAWTIDAALPVSRDHSGAQWRCEAHEADYQREFAKIRQEEEERRRLDEERRLQAADQARRRRVIRAARVVDIYPKQARSPMRNVYVLLEHHLDGAITAVAVERNGKELLRLPARRGATPRLWNRLMARSESDLEAARVRLVAETDSPMGWAKSPLAQRIAWELSWQLAARTQDAQIMRELTALRVAGEPPLSLDDTHPRMFRRNRTTGEWFLLNDLRTETWDRDRHDPLTTPHQITGRTPPPRAATPAIDHYLDVGPVSPLAGPASRRAGGTRARFREAAPAARRTVVAADFGDVLARVERGDGLVVYELTRVAGEPERLIVVLERRLDIARVREIDGAMVSNGSLRLWIARREFWSPDLAGLPWLPLVVAPNGVPGEMVPGIAVNGFAIPLAAAASSFVAGSPDFYPDAVAARRSATRMKIIDGRRS